MCFENERSFANIFVRNLWDWIVEGEISAKFLFHKQSCQIGDARCQHEVRSRFKKFDETFGHQVSNTIKTFLSQVILCSSNKEKYSFLNIDTRSLRLLDTYAQYNPSPLSIQQFVDFGRNATEAESFNFLRKEIPIRLSNIMKELNLLPSTLLQMPSVMLLQVNTKIY